MRMMKSIALMPMLALTLAAEAPKVTLQGHMDLVGAVGDLNKMVDTGNLTGYNAGLGVNLETKPGFGFRLYTNMLSIRGIDGSGLESTKPKHFNAGVDIFQEMGKVTFFGGLGYVDWRQNPATLSSFSDANGANNSGKGKKFAGRIGLEYAFTPKIHGVVSFTQTEFNKIYQPAWFGFGIAYRFLSF